MKSKELLDLYSDYLLASFGATTATGLSQLVDNLVSHDQITRFLASETQTAKDLWQVVKPLVRTVQSKRAVLIIDDSIEEKPYTDENEIVSWHYDHSKDRSIKGINFVSALYESNGVSLPVGFEVIHKTEFYIDKKTGKEKRRSAVSKNEICRRLITQAIKNELPFEFVLFDSWFAAAENMKFIKLEHGRDFLCPLKSNRKVALSLSDKLRGRFQAVETLKLEPHAVTEIYLEAVEFPLALAKQIFTNEDGSTGILYLVSSDTTLDYNRMTTSYQRRWQVECYHKSLKQNVSLSKSPTQTERTQQNHLFAALCGYAKLEMLKVETRLNHFALKSKLYLNALHSAFSTLRQLNPIQLAA
jgi:hypothetical protein